MNKSKIFLSAAALLLAGAAAFATKKAGTVSYFIRTAAGYLLVPAVECAPTPGLQCTYLTAGGINHAKVYYATSDNPNIYVTASKKPE
ncbi:DUF6520 family protein [Deminuibacter soli]|uniref:Uncharacterized protein n=1 Tax=Deminuibacter soli TaxID=2291815 RepID=A0A3E1NJ78_9BACT|nr:DUF6520 family protein [Deminuibacter soli]RFM27838.1 hypothetical protein DXN05_14180 [Deminuibacter soli]